MFQVNEKNKSNILRINQIMSKLLPNSAVVSVVTLHFEQTDHLHISHSLYHLSNQSMFE